LAPSDEHDCTFRQESLRLAAELQVVKDRLAALERQAFGKKSEKMPPMGREVRKKRPADPEVAKQRRRDNAAAKLKLETEVVPVPVPDAARCCPACGKDKLKPVGNGTPSVVYHYVAGHFRRRIHQRETLACSCGDYIVTAPCPDKVFDRSPYAPSFVAHLVVAKCDDGIPLYRLEKQYARTGIPIARSTMTDLFHRAAELLAPLSRRILARIGRSPIVFADETTLKMQTSSKKAYVWVFLTDKLVGFDFSPSRSGDTPARTLGDSTGELVVDQYTGYNQVTLPGRRHRAGCLAHARRKIFEAKELPEAVAALDLIRDIYLVEHDARAAGCEGTDEHLAMRIERSRPLMARLLAWARRQRRVHVPKSPMGKAAGYLVRNHKALTRFLHVAALPPDNNRSEAALRRVALGRKNYLFVGHEDAGKNIAGLFSLIASCDANGVNPIAYLTDVLTRISDETDVDALLPDRWRPPPDS
jgi:transposase